jgi:aryl-alcohol dehydrogenase-like predicted oxidoreductase
VKRRPFACGVEVGILGLGAGQIGDPGMAESKVEALVRGALDLGVNLFDTARSYGVSEERLGRHLQPVRDRVVLSTKIGYGVDGVEDWTGECIRLGIDAALRRLQTDRIEVVHLHSCPAEVLRRQDVIAELVAARDAGKILCAAYSGDNEDIDVALSLGVFDSVQTSISYCDQRAIEYVLPVACANGLGVIAKRPLANAPWRFTERPVGAECEEYWLRHAAMALDTGGLDFQEMAIRFAGHAEGVSAIITGTRSLDHLRQNVQALAKGPLSAERDAAIRAAFAERGPWPGKI